MATLKNLTEREALWIWDSVTNAYLGDFFAHDCAKPIRQEDGRYSIAVDGVTRPQLADVRRQLRSDQVMIRTPW